MDPKVKWAAVACVSAVGAALVLRLGVPIAEIVWDSILLAQAKRREQIRSRKRPKRIYLIRHGQSAGQIDPCVYSKVPDNEVPLTKLGIQQAREAGKQLRQLIGNESVKFWHSPYRRCVMTLDGVLEAFRGQQYILAEEPRLREQDYGNFQDVEGIKKCIIDRRRFGIFYYRFPQGESGADVYDRVSTFLESLFRDFHQNGDYYEHAVFVSHGITIRMFLTRYLKWSVDRFQRTWNLDNCQIIILEKQEDGRYKLVPENQLKEDKTSEAAILRQSTHALTWVEEVKTGDKSRTL